MFNIESSVETEEVTVLPHNKSSHMYYLDSGI